MLLKKLKLRYGVLQKMYDSQFKSLYLHDSKQNRSFHDKHYSYKFLFNKCNQSGSYF